MPCNRCGMENERTDVVCISCGARLPRPARVPGAVCNSGRYAVRRHGAASALPISRYRAKRGFAVTSGVLPTAPVQTASAASPPRALPRRARQTDLPLPRSVSHGDRPRPAAAPRPIAAAAPPATHRPQPQTRAPARPEPKPEPSAPRAGAARAAAPARRPPGRPARVQRQPGPRRGAPSHPILTGSMVVAGLLLGMGGTWLATVRGIDPLALTWPTRPAPVIARQNPAIPPLATATPPAERTAPPATAPEPPQRQEVETAEAPRTPADTAEPAAMAETAVPVKEQQETQVPPQPVKPRGATVRQARKRSPPVARQDRSEEIGRLRTQAFSETRKDRVGRISGARSANKVPISSLRSARLTSATRRAYNECDNSANILRREQCRWKVCGGRWGRNGCPSYDVKQASLN